MLGLLGLRIFEACGASIGDLREEHGHRVLRVRGKGGKVVLVPLPPAVARAIDNTIGDLREEHGHRVLRVCGKGGKVVLVPLPPAVARAIDKAIGERTDGPVLRNMIGGRMDRHAATRRLKHLAATAGGARADSA